VHSYRHVLVSLLLLLAVFYGAPVAAKPLLTVTCEDPKGSEVSYGRGLLGLWELTINTATAEYPAWRYERTGAIRLTQPREVGNGLGQCFCLVPVQEAPDPGAQPEKRVRHRADLNILSTAESDHSHDLLQGHPCTTTRQIHA
jgi:hypothetical protein